MKSLFEVILFVFIGWLFLRWLTGMGGGPLNLGGALDSGWPYAAPLVGPGPSSLAWRPPYGNDWATYFGLNYGPNSGPMISFGYQGVGGQ